MYPVASFSTLTTSLPPGLWWIPWLIACIGTIIMALVFYWHWSKYHPRKSVALAYQFVFIGVSILLLISGMIGAIMIIRI